MTVVYGFWQGQRFLSSDLPPNSAVFFKFIVSMELDPQITFFANVDRTLSAQFARLGTVHHLRSCFERGLKQTAFSTVSVNTRRINSRLGYIFSTC
jgi:hypothetical protein